MTLLEFLAHSRFKQPPKQNINDGKNPAIWTQLNTARTGKQYREDYKAIKAGYWYILEIVRPYNQETRDKYSLDGTRNVNGSYRIVSTQKMYVSRVVAHSNKLELDCRGVDNYGRRDDRTYIFYQTPDSLNQRDTYILSIKRC